MKAVKVTKLQLRILLPGLQLVLIPRFFSGL